MNTPLSTYERRDARFGLVLNSAERAALQALAEHERITAAAVLRRLLWNAAKELDNDPKEV